MIMLRTGDKVEEIALDISDLLVYTSHHRNVSGIQRVQVNLAHSFLEEKSVKNNVLFVNFDFKSGHAYQILKDHLIEYLRMLRDNEVTHEALKLFIAEMIDQALPWHADDQSAYIVTGAFWMFANSPALYKNLKHSGCIVACLIYDLIPISHPEFCDAGLVATFQAAIDSGLPFFDLILTISEFTATEVLRYLDANNSRPTLVIPVPLAHSIRDEPVDAGKSYPELQVAAFSDYVLCVGTIEARKNHVYLFQVWKLLIESGMRNIPKLVIVGRWGWRVDDLKQQLEASAYLSGHIVVLSEIDDSILEILYQNCLFTILPSFVEGWGLPVGESLTHGKLCIASQTSSIPEVGKNFVEYIDPYNARHGFETVSKFINNRNLITHRESLIRTRFRQRTWKQVANDFADALNLGFNHEDFVTMKGNR